MAGHGCGGAGHAGGDGRSGDAAKVNLRNLAATIAIDMGMISFSAELFSHTGAAMRWAGVFVVALPLLFSVNIAKADHARRTNPAL